MGEKWVATRRHPQVISINLITHSKSINDGAACGRLRVIDQESTFSPTFLKSQDRMAKDSVVVAHDGRYFFPDAELMKALMGIPKSFSVDAVSKSVASEIIGQSIDYVMHHKVTQAIRRHIDSVEVALRGKKQMRLPLPA